MATDNMNGVMGYDSRIRIKGTNKADKTKSPIPTTLLNNFITDYCSRPQKIMFILQKSDDIVRFSEIVEQDSSVIGGRSATSAG